MNSGYHSTVHKQLLTLSLWMLPLTPVQADTHLKLTKCSLLVERHSTQTLAISSLPASVGHPWIIIPHSQKEAPLLFSVIFDWYPSTVFKINFLIYLPRTLLRQLEVKHNIPSTNPQNLGNASSGHQLTYDTLSSPPTTTNTTHLP